MIRFAARYANASQLKLATRVYNQAAPFGGNNRCIGPAAQS
jgi:hypothetical protein